MNHIIFELCYIAMRRILYITLFLTVSLAARTQTGGDNVYEFLNLTSPASVSSLGGVNVSLGNNDLNLAYHNPALLQQEMDKNLAFSYVNYFAGINYGLALYSFSTAKKGNFAGGISYLNYGSFTGADAAGIITGTFKASEYAFPLIWSLPIDSAFTIGASFKPVISFLESYSSIGFASDVGASWQSSNGLTTAGITLKNIGLQLTKYAGEERQKLPFEIMAGITQKLAHAPLRFSLTLRHLEKYDLTHNYNDSTSTTVNTLRSTEFFENMMRHVIAGVELIPHKNLWISAGYNYQRRRELQVDSKVGAVGFSWGFGINTSLLSLQFGRASYHLAGASNHFTVILNSGAIYSRLRR